MGEPGQDRQAEHNGPQLDEDQMLSDVVGSKQHEQDTGQGEASETVILAAAEGDRKAC